MSIKLSQITQVVVVTYNPRIKLLEENLHALTNQFKYILVVDNDSKNIDEIEELIKKTNSKIRLCKLHDNMGIARAQNIGLKQAIDKKLSWLLTMDQDSVVPENLTTEYQKVIDQYDNIGLIAWSQRPNDQKDDKEIIRQDWLIISSGCLLNTGVLQMCGGFDEKLFIDHVDTDVNIKIRNLGYKTLTTNWVKLIHQLGTQTAKKTIRGNPYITHTPVRIRYNVRNSVALFKRYFFKQPQWAMIAIINCIREGIYLLYYQPNKFKNFLLLLKAWRDGLFNRLGKFYD